MTADQAQARAWFRELRTAVAITPQIVLYGNVQDRYLLPDDRIVRSMPEAVWSALQGSGFEAVVVLSPVAAPHVIPAEAAAVASAVIGRDLSQQGEPPTLEGLCDLLVGAVTGEAARQHAVAIVVEQASRIAPRPDGSPAAQQFFAAMERLTHVAHALPRPAGDRAIPLFTPVIWLAGHDHDLPAWFVSDRDRVRSIAVPVPDYAERERYVGRLLTALPGWDDADEHTRHEQVTRLVRQTDGLTMTALQSINTLARDSGRGLDGIEDAARTYRVGVADNPWRAASLRERLADAEDELERRVLGQREAVRKALDIVERAAVGLSGAHGKPNDTRPRGVLFFAGPTGVGKTELAKQLTELIFGDARAYVRFDMSEFAAEHAADRLIGAPPGYVGFDAGGELTNAIRERPFSLVLFDEIDKAHPRILDKFLQILEDGRLTDGRGTTAYFSEAVLVFTSNLGIWVPGEGDALVPNVTREMDRDEVETRIQQAIRDFFTRQLGRPEILNRIGDNIVVFDFIDDETALGILRLIVGNVVERVRREHRAELVVGPAAMATLGELALGNLDNGGRGVGSVVENALVNPLARALFDMAVEPGMELTIEQIERVGRTFEVRLA